MLRQHPHTIVVAPPQLGRKPLCSAFPAVMWRGMDTIFDQLAGAEPAAAAEAVRTHASALSASPAASLSAARELATRGRWTTSVAVL